MFFFFLFYAETAHTREGTKIETNSTVGECWINSAHNAVDNINSKSRGTGEWRNQHKLHAAHLCLYLSEENNEKERKDPSLWMKTGKIECQMAQNLYWFSVDFSVEKNMATKLQFTDRELWWPFADKKNSSRYILHKSIPFLLAVPTESTTTEFVADFLKSYVVVAEKLNISQFTR